MNEFTDEAAIVENAGHKVQIFESEKVNTKLTTKKDIEFIS